VVPLHALTQLGSMETSGAQDTTEDRVTAGKV
jgi:hypothetical protein